MVNDTGFLEVLEDIAGSGGDAQAAPPRTYRATLQIASEIGPKMSYDIPEAMADAGATLHQMILYARGKEIRVADKRFSKESSRAQQDFAKKLTGEMDGREYSIVLIQEGGARQDVHGDYVSFRSHGAEREGNILELPTAIVVGGRTLGYR